MIGGVAAERDPRGPVDALRKDRQGTVDVLEFEREQPGPPRRRTRYDGTRAHSDDRAVECIGQGSDEIRGLLGPDLPEKLQGDMQVGGRHDSSLGLRDGDDGDRRRMIT